MRRLRLSGVSAIAFLAAAGPALAQDANLGNMPASILKQLQPGIAIEQVIAQALQPIRQLDTAGDGLDAGDIDFREAMNNAEQRASQVGQALRADLDGDGKVGAAEVERIIAQQMAQREVDPADPAGVKIRRQMTEEYLRYDTDQDGVVSFDEMRQIPPGSGRRAREFETYRALLALDPDADGRLTVAEMEQLVRAAFAQIDQDGDGEISRAEYRPHQQALQEAAAMASLPPCDLPKPASGDQFLTLGMSYGAAVSTLAVTGQEDVTHLSRIVVEPGVQPLYLVVSAHVATVWRVEGAVERISSLVVIPREQAEAGPSEFWAGAAVTGLPKEKVTFTTPRACGGNLTKRQSKEGRLTERAILQSVGRAPDLMIGTDGAEIVAVPSGQVTKRSRDRDVVVTGKKTLIIEEGGDVAVMENGMSLVEHEDWLSKSGGIVEVKPEDVVAPGKVEPYVVIPGQEGLRLLVEQGVLARTAEGYRVLKPLARWPAGLSGAHSVTFILPKGIPEPAGSPGHSRVIMEP